MSMGHSMCSFTLGHLQVTAKMLWRATGAWSLAILDHLTWLGGCSYKTADTSLRCCLRLFEKSFGVIFSLFLVKKEMQRNENSARSKLTRECAFLRFGSVTVPANATHTHGQAVDGAYSIEP